jgi:hypothetical protein
MRWAGHVECIAVIRGAYRVLVWRPDGKRPLGRSWCEGKDIIKMDLQDV